MMMSTEEDHKQTPTLTEEMREMLLSKPKYIYYKQFIDLCYRDISTLYPDVIVENKIIIEEMFYEYYNEISFLFIKFADKYHSKNSENIPKDFREEERRRREIVC